MQTSIIFGRKYIRDIKIEASDSIDYVWKKARIAYVDETCTGCIIRAIRGRIYFISSPLELCLLNIHVRKSLSFDKINQEIFLRLFASSCDFTIGLREP